jgi:hypothetical protein
VGIENHGNDENGYGDAKCQKEELLEILMQLVHAGNNVDTSDLFFLQVDILQKFQLVRGKQENHGSSAFTTGKQMLHVWFWWYMESLFAVGV